MSRSRRKDPEDQLPLTPSVFHILVALSDGERHGYAIMRQVTSDTDGAVALGPGTLYGCLQRMMAAGLVEESDVRPDPWLDDERRRYFRITDFGSKVVRAEAKRLAAALKSARARHLLPEKSGT
jgi:DNA-binding PadR family transcriptional regulator